MQLLQILFLIKAGINRFRVDVGHFTLYMCTIVYLYSMSNDFVKKKTPLYFCNFPTESINIPRNSCIAPSCPSNPLRHETLHCSMPPPRRVAPNSQLMQGCLADRQTVVPSFAQFQKVCFPKVRWIEETDLMHSPVDLFPVGLIPKSCSCLIEK